MRRIMTLLVSVSALGLAACPPPSTVEYIRETRRFTHQTWGNDELLVQPLLGVLHRSGSPDAVMFASAMYREGGFRAVDTVTFRVGGNLDSPVTAGDCVIRIKGGEYYNAVFIGIVVPILTSQFEITPDDIGPEPIRVEVVFDRGTATVKDYGAAVKLCPNGEKLDGHYSLRAPPQ